MLNNMQIKPQSDGFLVLILKFIMNIRNYFPALNEQKQPYIVCWGGCLIIPEAKMFTLGRTEGKTALPKILTLIWNVIECNETQYKILYFLLPGLFWSCSAVLWVLPLQVLKDWLLKSFSHCMLWHKFSRKRRANDALLTGGRLTEWVSPSKEAIGREKMSQLYHRKMRSTILTKKSSIQEM